MRLTHPFRVPLNPQDWQKSMLYRLNHTITRPLRCCKAGRHSANCLVVTAVHYSSFAVQRRKLGPRFCADCVEPILTIPHAEGRPQIL